ncbi:Myelin-associated neurite-outgrowth inhibitor [Frankliniella fusca]|uniref:Myelin-associated neurite-outgrowth inhibitor n=1 Tax=Frankliniella fusca TaxID=407009 RepID=A0AAE1HWI3_9NEOP|nr:Myelin-associated neurite-outgrowth inhibitor [Frankliniella fusca]
MHLGCSERDRRAAPRRAAPRPDRDKSVPRLGAEQSAFAFALAAHLLPMFIAIKHILHETGNADSFVTDDAILGIPLLPSAGHKSIVAKVDAFRTFTKTR